MFHAELGDVGDWVRTWVQAIVMNVGSAMVNGIAEMQRLLLTAVDFVTDLPIILRAQGKETFPCILLVET